MCSLRKRRKKNRAAATLCDLYRYIPSKVSGKAFGIVNSRGNCHNKTAAADGVNRKSRDNKLRIKEEEVKEGKTVSFRQTHIWSSFLSSVPENRASGAIVRKTRPGLLGEDVASRRVMEERRGREGTDVS